MMQIKSEHLIHIKAKFMPDMQKTKSERLICYARKCDADEI